MININHVMDAPQVGGLVLLVLVVYIGASPRFGQELYRRRLFTDKEARPSQPDLVEQFAWSQKRRVEIGTESGVKLNAWFFQSNEFASPWRKDHLILYCIGRCSKVSNCLEEIKIFLESGYSVLITEYRGFGESPGNPSIDTICQDGLAAFDYAVEELKYSCENIVVFGESLGGGVAGYIIRHRRPGALLLKNTFTSLKEIGSETVPLCRIYPRAMYPDNHLNTLEAIRQWDGPLLVVHAVNDETIAFHHGVRLFETALQAKWRRFLDLPRSSHRFMLDPVDVSAFVRELNHLTQAI